MDYKQSLQSYEIDEFEKSTNISHQQYYRKPEYGRKSYGTARLTKFQ